MNEIGHNQGPDMASTASEVTMDLSAWLAEHPIIQTEDEAREGKLLADRSKLCVADLEDERKNKTGTLNDQIKKINDHYREPRTLLEKVLNVLQERLSTFLNQEEEKRLIAAEEARKRAEEAEQAAREAEKTEKEAIQSAAMGELGIDVVQLTRTADETFRSYEKALHQASIAERESKVKIGGGFRKALGLKNKEELLVINAVVALEEMGSSEEIDKAICKKARAYRKLHGRLPNGIRSEIERKV